MMNTPPPGSIHLALARDTRARPLGHQRQRQQRGFMTDSENKKQPTENQSSTLVPFPNPQEVDRELYDLHGIPYPENTQNDSKGSGSQPQT